MKNLPLGRLGVGGRCAGGSEVHFSDLGAAPTAWSILSVDRGNPIDLVVGLLGRFSSWVVKLVTMIHRSLRRGKANTIHCVMWLFSTDDQG